LAQPLLLGQQKVNEGELLVTLMLVTLLLYQQQQVTLLLVLLVLLLLLLCRCPEQCGLAAECALETFAAKHNVAAAAELFVTEVLACLLRLVLDQAGPIQAGKEKGSMCRSQTSPAL
jgi:hypothetical protein